MADYLDCEIWRVGIAAIGTANELLLVSVKLRRCPLSAWAQDPEGMAFAADLAEIQQAIDEAMNVVSAG